MDNGSTIDATSERDAVDVADLGAASLTLTTTGYCAGCGTWDSHHLTCSTCGYDFTGASSPDGLKR